MKIDMPYKRWKKAVHRRSSRRKYYPEPIEKEARDILENSVKVLKKEFPLSRVIIKQKGFSEVSKNIIGSYGLITGASSYAIITGKTSEDNFKANIHAGVVGEGLILEATSFGLNTCWMGGFFDRKEVSSEVEIEDDEEILAITPLGEAKDSLTITERLAKLASGSRKRKPLSELCDEDFSHKAKRWMKRAVKLARLAPSAMNRQPWRFVTNGEELKLVSAIQKKKQSVSPYLDCGIALIHLLVGAGVGGVNIDLEYGEPPEVATIQPKD